MTSRLAGVLFFVWAVVCASIVDGCARPSVPKAPDAEDLDSEVVALVANSPRTGELAVFCTATWISDNRMLTAAHCVMLWPELGQEPQYSTYREAGDIEEDITRSHALVVEAVDTEADLALLRAPKPTGHKSASIAKFTPEIGEHVFVVGHPSGLTWTHREGIVAAYRRLHGPMQDDGTFIYGNVMQVSAPIWFGNSGGACFNADGEIVGVFSYIRVDVPDVAFFTQLKAIQKFLLRHMV